MHYELVTKFTFPNVKNGSIVEYQYTVLSPQNFLWVIPRFYVEQELPTKYMDFWLDAPKFLGYNINYRGALKPNVREYEAKNIYGGEYQVYRFGYDNVPAYKDEKFVLNNDNYKTVIKAELNSYNTVGLNSSNPEYKSFATSWEDIRKRLYENENFGGELKRDNLIKDLLPSEIKSISNPVEK